MPERTCSVPDCNGLHLARGYCGKHYQRWAKFGTPLPYGVQPATDGETWRPVAGYEGIYEVSDLGRVRRVTMGAGTWTGRAIRDTRSGRGYRKVHLYRADQRRQIAVHRLVAAAFLGPCPVGHQVNHRDGNKANNALPNLEYIPAPENREHASRTGLVRSGERHQNAKLTAEQVAEIRRLYRPRVYSMARLGREFGVCAETIHRIVRGTAWNR